MYGQCEATSCISLLPPQKALEKIGSVGVVFPGGEIELHDENGNLITEPHVPGELIYRGKNVALGYAAGGEDLIRDENGQPTGETKMPGDNDWGKPGYAIYYLLDVMADTLGLDEDVEEAYKGYVWEELHFEKMREQIYRETDGEITGQFFQPGENYFVSGELFMMHNLAEAYVLKYAG